MTKFKSLLVGEFNHQRFEKHKDLYADLCHHASVTLEELKAHIPNIDAAVVVELIATPEPEKHIRRLYVAEHQHKFPGLDLAKLIISGHAVLPDEIHESVKYARKAAKYMREIHAGGCFIYPLIELYSFEDEMFSITKEFEDQLHENCGEWTKSITENEILMHLNNISEACNYLNSRQIVNFKTFGPASLGVLAPLFRRSKQPTAPITVYPQVFNSARFAGVRPRNNENRAQSVVSIPEKYKRPEPEQPDSSSFSKDELDGLQYFVYAALIDRPIREVAKYGDHFYELDDLNKKTGHPKKNAEPIKFKPFESVVPQKAKKAKNDSGLITR